MTETASKRFTIKPDSLAQSIMLLCCLTLIQRTAGFGRSILLCRWLAPGELGHWDLTLAFLDMAAPIAVLSLPACFSRYVEHYRQRGRLRFFVQRVSLATFCLILVSIALVYWQRSWFSRLLYDEETAESVYLIILLLFVLPAVILMNTIHELFSGMRMFRAVTMLQFAQSLLFAALALSLTGLCHGGADGVIAGYGLTCLLCSALPLYWLIRMWRNLNESPAPAAGAAFWGRLLPFAGAVWANNMLQNAFLMTDRYMILHHSGLEGSAAAAAVGQYHSARVVPLLLVQLAAVIATMFIPYFSCDWEAGRRHVVRNRLNTLLKLSGLALVMTAVLILVVSPILFDVFYAGKFPAGKAILPWTLLAAMWYSMFCFGRIYLWCDERVGLACVGSILGLGVNVGVALLLLPRWGIQGAAVAASLANLTLLLVIYGLVVLRGMRISMGTWIISAAPATICLGPWLAAGSLGALLLASAGTTWIFSRDEKQELISIARGYIGRASSLRARWLARSNDLDARAVAAALEESV
jgi:polysaccharide transporter, PST family